jgi:hypothetical protein
LPWFRLIQALAGKALDGKKGSLCGIHESCDSNIKAHYGTSLRSVEACGSGSVFATRTSRFNKTQGALRLCGALQLAPHFLSRSFAAILS